MSLSGKAVWYIESHLHDDVTLDAVAQSVGVSRFHLSRAFSVATGMSLTVYARARRLSEAARALADGAPDILTVAIETGYGSHEAFTRAFRQCLGVTPEKYRALPSVERPKLQEPFPMHTPTLTFPLEAARIEERGELLLFGPSRPCSAAGDPGIPAQWREFGRYIGHIEGQVGRAAYGAIYNSDEEAGSYDYMCAVEVRAFPAEPKEFARLRIAPQTYAVFAHRGHVASIAQTWQAIWERGISEAGCTAAEGPAFERYGEEFDPMTGTGGFEIWVPVAPR
ncbi:MAG: AraC family transcriptional regulator [Bryobacterales bacterium]|nr:AraC family transcriptional regulator [Bryobacterales bacterium]